MGIIFKKQTAVSQEARWNSAFLGINIFYTAERLEESLRKLLLCEDGLVDFNGDRNSMNYLIIGITNTTKKTELFRKFRTIIIRTQDMRIQSQITLFGSLETRISEFAN